MIGHRNCRTLEHCCSILRLIFSVGGVHFGKGTIMVDLVATWASVLWRSSIVDELLGTGVTVKLWEVLFVSLNLHSVGLWFLINDLVLLLNLALLISGQVLIHTLDIENSLSLLLFFILKDQ